MGVTWEIRHSGRVSLDHVQAACDLVARDEQRYSRFVKGGRIARINAVPGVPIVVDQDLFDLMSACDDWRERTGGVFNPLVGGALRAWGYADSRSLREPGTLVSPTAQSAPEFPLVHDAERRMICAQPGTHVDLGGIAPMWTGRKVAALLRERSDDERIILQINNDLIAVAGDHFIRLDGDDTAGGLHAVILRAGHGLARSSAHACSWTNGDRGVAHHLIDPRTGSPAEPAHAIVACLDPVEADVYATALAVCPALASQIPGTAFVAFTQLESVSRKLRRAA